MTYLRKLFPSIPNAVNAEELNVVYTQRTSERLLSLALPASLNSFSRPRSLSSSFAQLDKDQQRTGD